MALVLSIVNRVWPAGWPHWGRLATLWLMVLTLWASTTLTHTCCAPHNANTPTTGNHCQHQLTTPPSSMPVVAVPSVPMQSSPQLAPCCVKSPAIRQSAAPEQALAMARVVAPQINLSFWVHTAAITAQTTTSRAPLLNHHKRYLRLQRLLT